MTYLVNKIKWDTDGSSYKTCCLPVSVKVDENELEENGYLNGRLLDEAIADWLSDQFGYCVETFNFYPVNKIDTSKIWTEWEKIKNENA